MQKRDFYATAISLSLFAVFLFGVFVNFTPSHETVLLSERAFWAGIIFSIVPISAILLHSQLELRIKILVIFLPFLCGLLFEDQFTYSAGYLNTFLFGNDTEVALTISGYDERFENFPITSNRCFGVYFAELPNARRHKESGTICTKIFNSREFEVGKKVVITGRVSWMGLIPEKGVIADN